MFHHSVSTPFGTLSLIWSQHEGSIKISRILLPGKQRIDGKQAERNLKTNVCPEINAIARQLHNFLSGKAVHFSLDMLRWDLCSPFQEKVLRGQATVPRGSTLSYKGLAQRIGHPGAARAVGTALANNPFPLIIPCHRTIRADNTPGQFGGGRKMKKRLLALEGVTNIILCL
ncbi:MAG: hypothetical protein A2293_15895 [Elusimicrobia bacterium RIFOXYB2_FULL_49_7]|nr:MAG: hypothetical protein A2293_15895 [Elusimicrobia bacterium RIFOXYB2_FULL_49_7]